MLPQLFPEGINRFPPAILALADGTIFRGVSIGAPGHTVAEVVFNTAMTGYQEILTDPSYSGQIVTLTYPHIGNTGVNAEDVEANRVYAAGLVVRDCPARVSNFRSTQSLPEYLSEQGIVTISGIDTRKLTRILREKGAQGACIFVGSDADRAVELARGFAGMAGQDLAKVVSIKDSTTWTQGTWQLGEGYTQPDQSKFHVVAYDFGIKSNILRLLADRGCRLTLVPAQTSAEDVLKLNPDGVFLSNGPGDPEPCDYAIDATRVFLDKKLPVFGICLGHQIMGLAVGGKTLKMKTGHHGANHPVQDLASKRVFITSQNHGFAVDAASLPANARVTHVSLFDGTLQGFELTDRPAFCFQGHPEASPGPHDILELFDKFISLMSGQK
ncbi:glutamine-hydrolyzing carbamoyl-phosphate synthase small subunit [Achromobacter ruhlandii]|uniref:glutamine-hydrolyzing carbamoyl-phosphate synthase small subunit n=1 Tax=Achromobacter ruhlandii TaxID=72557 RepID=UPI001EEEB4E1|nr:glutamine-hydrolyzing carbamoyl-phosphate synthase small subunit [Achromobacter ruhlandii]MCZ8398376.1 glutamine-hydrolyzing carbamoyl-phosphate synthase small subunit [Achromobacter ruhlandii]